MRGQRSTARALTQSALFIFGAWLLALCLTVATANADIVLVRKAIDGDSLLLADGRQVRLIGINTPEFGKDGAPNQPLARTARDRVTALAGGQRVQLIYDQERIDRYGRSLAYAVLPDNRDLQDILLREGLAWFVAIPPNIARLAKYQRAEAEARSARRGIWAQSEYEPISADRIRSDRSGFLRMSGIVISVKNRRDAIELHLSPSVYLEIPRTIFTAWGQSPHAFNGKRVLARGWLAAYKGNLRMRITHAAMLEVS